MKDWVFIEPRKKDFAEVMLVPKEETEPRRRVDWFSILHSIYFTGKINPTLKIIIKIIAWLI